VGVPGVQQPASGYGHNNFSCETHCAPQLADTKLVRVSSEFLAEIDKETTAAHFTYGELEENDEDLAKLRGWFDKFAARDRLGATGRDAAVKALKECSHALDGFAEAVYAADLDAP